MSPRPLSHLKAQAPRRREVLASLAGLGSTLVFPGSALTEIAPRGGGILKVSAATNPSSLDPMTGGSGLDHTFLWTMYDTLVEWDYETLTPKPGLAQWSYPKPTTMVLDIQPNVFFHDGTALSADAVKFNLDRSRSDPQSNIKADLASIAAVDVTGSQGSCSMRSGVRTACLDLIRTTRRNAT